MKNLWPKYKVSIILTSIGGLFHLIFVVYPLVASGFVGEGIAFLVIFADFPLWWLKSAVTKYLGLGFSTSTLILYYSILGTLMYALAGWIAGRIWNYLIRPFPKQ